MPKKIISLNMVKRVYAGFKGPAPKRAKYAAKPKGYYTKLRSTISAGRGSVGSQLKTVVRAINKQAPEIKYIDSTYNFANIGDPGTLTPFLAVSQGDTVGSRAGNSICVKHITLRMLLSRIYTGVPIADSFARVFIVRDKQGPDGVAPAVSDIFVGDAVTAMPALGLISRFDVVFRSKLLNVNMIGADADGVTTIPPTQTGFVECDMDLSTVINFSGPNTTDYSKNMLYLVVMTTDTGDTVDLAGRGRTMFTDA